MTWPSYDDVIAAAALAVEIGGAATGVLRWRHTGRGQRAIALWFVAASVVDVLIYLFSGRVQNSQQFARVWFAASVVFGVGALAAYVSARRDVLAFRAAIGFYVVAWVTLALTIEPFAKYSTYSEPLHALVILGAATVILLRRTALGRGDMLLDPAFLIAAGLSGYAVGEAFKTPVAQLWTVEHRSYATAYYAACNTIILVAELVLIRAMLLPANPTGRKTG